MNNVTVRDVNSHAFIQTYAAYLKRSGNIEIPTWVDIVKTGISRELAPYDPDWFYIRTASIARFVFLKPCVGIGALRTRYGSSKNRGSRPSHHVPASGCIVRKALQALEKLNIVFQDTRGGRSITSEGRKELNRIAAMCKSKPQV